MFQKNKTRTCAYQGVRNVHISENLACFVFLKHPFLDLPFCFITDELRDVKLALKVKECKQEYDAQLESRRRTFWNSQAFWWRRNRVRGSGRRRSQGQSTIGGHTIKGKHSYQTFARRATQRKQHSLWESNCPRRHQQRWWYKKICTTSRRD